MKVVAVSNANGEVTDGQLLAAAERVHRQLRPHLKDYVGRMKEVLAGGAEMAVCVVDGEVAGVTVFRVLEKTHSGRDLYCDDLVADEAKRSTGVGHALMQYMEGICRERSCDTFSLDSGCPAPAGAQVLLPRRHGDHRVPLRQEDQPQPHRYQALVKPVNVGLLGIGTVGSGTFHVLERNREEITRRAGRQIQIAMVGARNVEKARAVVVPDSVPVQHRLARGRHEPPESTSSSK